MQDSRALRAVDRYIGSFACAAIGGLRCLVPKRKRKNSIKRVLMIELFEMGAAVMLLPSIRAMQEKEPGVEIHVLTTSTCLPIWHAMNIIEEKNLHIIQFSSATHFILSALKQVIRLRSINFDLILDYELFMRVSAILSGLLRSRERAGFYKYDLEGLSKGGFYDHISAYNQNTHIAKNFLSLTHTALLDAKDSPNYKGNFNPDSLRLNPIIPSPERKKLMQLIGSKEPNFSYLVLCPDVGNTLAMRNYPVPSFSEVCGRLMATHPELRFVFIGTESDRTTSEAILSSIPKQDFCFNLCGKTSFSELLSLIAGAELLITNDNGPAHFSALTGTKTLALFSTDSPFVYGPLGDTVIAYSHFQCSPCISAYNHKTSRCDNNKCLQAISPAQVVDLAEAIMSGRARYRTINNLQPYLF